jgi:hypothetical protein
VKETAHGKEGEGAVIREVEGEAREGRGEREDGRDFGDKHKGQLEDPEVRPFGEGPARGKWSVRCLSRTKHQ